MAKAAAAPKAPKVDPSAIPATQAEAQAVRDGDAKADSTKPGPRASGVTLVPAPETELVAPADKAFAAVVPIDAKSAKTKGFRSVQVVATRDGYYGDVRRKEGSVFQLGLVGKGYLPSWVRLAKGEDTEPEVARSRGIPQASSSQEIIDDVTEDAGTEQPLTLGGGGRIPSRS